MTDKEKGDLYERFVSEYHRLDNQINQIKMDNFDLSPKNEKDISLLEEKKTYILGRIQQFN
jgi:hypothetical protein